MGDGVALLTLSPLDLPTTWHLTREQTENCAFIGLLGNVPHIGCRRKRASVPFRWCGKDTVCICIRKSSIVCITSPRHCFFYLLCVFLSHQGTIFICTMYVLSYFMHSSSCDITKIMLLQFTTQKLYQFAWSMRSKMFCSFQL